MPRKKENKRNDGYYEIKVIVDRTFDGKPIYKSFYSSKSKTDARAKAEAYKLELLQKKNEIEQITFEAYAADYLNRLESRVRENTFKSVEIVFRRHLVPYFGSSMIRGIKKADIEKYIEIKQKQFNLNYIKRHITNMASCMNDAICNGYLDVSPIQKIKYKRQPKSEKRVYTPEQTTLVLEYCKQAEYGLQIHMLLSYGMSRSEFLAITIDDVDFDNLTVSINKGAVRTKGAMLVSAPKNQHRNRLIAISEDTAKWIKSECRHKYIANPFNDTVLTAYRFELLYYAFMNDMHEYYLTQGIDMPVLNPHELRHTRATLWVNEGRNLFAIAEMLGWSDLSMLRKVYGHPDIMQLRKNLEI